MQLHRLFFLAATLSLLVAATSCSTRQAAALEGDWTVVKLGAESLQAGETTPTFGVKSADSLVYGSTGCNRYSSRATSRDLLKGNFDFSRMAVTRRYCHDAKYEGAWLETLGKVRRFALKDGRLCLYGEDGAVLAELERQ